MSAIGQYVHLYAKNYAEKGTNKIIQGASENAAAAMNRERENVRKRVQALRAKTNKENEKLEKRINELIDYLGGKDTNSKHTDPSKAQEVIRDMLDLEWEKFQLDLVNANVKSTSGNGGIGKIKSQGHYAGQGRNYEKILVDRIKKLNEVIEGTEKDIGKLSSQNEVPDLIAKVEMVKTLTKATQETILDMLKECAIKSDLNLKTDKDVVKVINELIAAYAPALGVSAAKGQLFENILALVPEKIQTIAEEEVEQVMRDAIATNVKGAEKGAIQFGRQFFSKGMLAKSKGNVLHESTAQFGDMIRTVRESQKKIDVSFQYSGKVWNISAKNISISPAWGALSKLITVTSGNSLLQMIQDEDVSFINHYLNLFASHTDTEYEGSFAMTRQGYIDTLKMMLLYKAITGDVYGRGQRDLATTFIVNNNKVNANHSHVKVVNVKDILTRIIGENDSNYTGKGMSINTQGINVLVDSHRYNNDLVEAADNAWARTGTARIANILNQVHAAKVHAAITVGSLMQ